MDIDYAARKLSSAIDYLDQNDGSQHDRLVLAFSAIEAVQVRCFDTDEQRDLWKAMMATATQHGYVSLTLAQLGDDALDDIESMFRKLDDLAQLSYKEWQDRRFGRSKD